jgi:hypothetical protein
VIVPAGHAAAAAAAADERGSELQGDRGFSLNLESTSLADLVI